MAKHRIVCVEKGACPSGRHEHVIAVGIGESSDHANYPMTVREVLASMEAGGTFYTQAGAYSARVGRYSCSRCSGDFIRTHPDDTRIDNLDHMRACSWRRR